MNPTNDLRYPIGKFVWPQQMTASDIRDAISDIRVLPDEIRTAVAGLTDTQLDTPYRPDGWTVRQVVHHLPDSHVNSYVRFRLALTEEEPAILPYNETRWAELPDARTAPVELSLNLLDSIHARWVLLLQALQPEHWSRTFLHPERGRLRLDMNACLYAWHGRHHLAHITGLRDRMRWN